MRDDKIKYSCAHLQDVKADRAVSPLGALQNTVRPLSCLSAVTSAARTGLNRPFHNGRPDKPNSTLQMAEYLGAMFDFHFVKTTDWILGYLTTLFQRNFL
jgi:hypothetical protein